MTSKLIGASKNLKSSSEGWSHTVKWAIDRFSGGGERSFSILTRIGKPDREFIIIKDLRVSLRVCACSASDRWSILNTVRSSSTKEMDTIQLESGGIDELNVLGKLTLQLMLFELSICAYCLTGCLMYYVTCILQSASNFLWPDRKVDTNQLDSQVEYQASSNSLPSFVMAQSRMCTLQKSTR